MKICGWNWKRRKTETLGASAANHWSASMAHKIFLQCRAHIYDCHLFQFLSKAIWLPIQSYFIMQWSLRLCDFDDQKWSWSDLRDYKNESTFSRKTFFFKKKRGSFRLSIAFVPNWLFDHKWAKMQMTFILKPKVKLSFISSFNIARFLGV